jgi:hypothetical protein
MGRRVPGNKHTEKIYDATACLALERLTASMESMLIPRTQRSQRAELKEDPEVRVWLDRVCGSLFAAESLGFDLFRGRGRRLPLLTTRFFPCVPHTFLR